MTKIIDIGPGPEQNPQSGKIGYAIAWLLGVPIPILLLVYLFTRAC